MKLLFLVGLVVCVSSLCLAQVPDSDVKLVSGQEEHVHHNRSYRGLLKVYKVLFTDQILNDCIYEHSCSEFSQGAFKTFGFFKGLMMTCDRLSRCNRSTLAETSRLQLNRQGMIKEHWDDYKK